MAVSSGYVVLVGSDGLGRGDQDLGRLLMQRFLHELVGVEPKPEEVIFINHGVKLTVEGSLVLGQLQRLEEQGVEIRSCSTCLDRLGLMDRLAVGARTSMDATVATLARATKVVSL